MGIQKFSVYLALFGVYTCLARPPELNLSNTRHRQKALLEE